MLFLILKCPLRKSETSSTQQTFGARVKSGILALPKSLNEGENEQKFFGLV